LCSLAGGCTQTSDGVVVTPKGNLTASAVSSAAEGAPNVTALNQSLFEASGCRLDAADCIVYARASSNAPCVSMIMSAIMGAIVVGAIVVL
jgi:hypothetical protein